MTEEAQAPRTATASPPRRIRPVGIPPIGVLLRLRFEPGSALTDEVFEAIAAGNPELRLERTAERELEIMSPAGGGSSDRNSELDYQLRRWTKQEGRGLGKCFDSSGGFILPNGAIRNPDASWIAQERWLALSRVEREKFLRLCPDFAAEIRSPSDRLAVVRGKMQEYIDQGARLAWLIDPGKGKVEIYRAGRAIEKLDHPKTLSGEEVLPGFVCDLEEILNA